MSASLWSWIAAAASCSGLWLSGYNPRWGWVYGIVCQGVWTAYGWFTNQPGMIALSVVFVVIYIRNLRRWRGTRFQRQPEAAPAGEKTLCRAGAAK